VLHTIEENGTTDDKVLENRMLEQLKMYHIANAEERLKKDLMATIYKNHAEGILDRHENTRCLQHPL
jgi:hypothetical protein